MINIIPTNFIHELFSLIGLTYQLDIKPENILWHQEENETIVCIDLQITHCQVLKLTEFGLAKEFGEGKPLVEVIQEPLK